MKNISTLLVLFLLVFSCGKKAEDTVSSNKDNEKTEEVRTLVNDDHKLEMYNAIDSDDLLSMVLVNVVPPSQDVNKIIKVIKLKHKILFVFISRNF